MTLFETESQYRERETIWRVFSLLPLYSTLAAGRIWRWFAVNIPMDLATGGVFTSDIDIIARLSDYPRSKEWIYKTWEVKVGLLSNNGMGHSLKVGKIRRTKTQLNAYREFGSPQVSLLDIYICESGFNLGHTFPPSSLNESISSKLAELRPDGFGYQLLPFEHDRDEDGNDVGLSALRIRVSPLQTTVNLVPAVEDRPREPFVRLADRLNTFFEQTGDRPRKSFNQIVFCRECRQLQLICMNDEQTCPACQSDLIIQSRGGRFSMCQYSKLAPSSNTSRSLPFQSGDLGLGLLAIVGLEAYVDCSGNLSFCLRDYFLAAFKCIFCAIPHLPNFLAGEFISFSCFLGYVLPGFRPGFRRKQNADQRSNTNPHQKIVSSSNYALSHD
jgi:hypothetical protein